MFPRPKELFPVVILRGRLEAVVEGVHANVLAAQLVDLSDSNSMVKWKNKPEL